MRILRDLASQDSRIVLLAEQEHLGITGNCTRHLARCTGRDVAFTAGDDIFLPGKIRTQVEWLEEDENRVLCGHDVEMFDTVHRQRIRLFSEMVPMRSGEGAAQVVEHFVPFGGCAIMVRRSALPPRLYDARLPLASDWKLWIDTLAPGGEWGYGDGVYSRWQPHGTNITRTEFEELYNDIFMTLALVEPAYPHLVGSAMRSRSKQYFETGKHHLGLGQTASAARYFRAAFPRFG